MFAHDYALVGLQPPPWSCLKGPGMVLQVQCGTCQISDIWHNFSSTVAMSQSAPFWLASRWEVVWPLLFKAPQPWVHLGSLGRGSAS